MERSKTVLIPKIRKRLIKWWEAQETGENLFPWRSPKICPYNAIVTEILLQRTRAEAVNNIYESFFDKFPDPRALCSATDDSIRTEINSLGLLWRAKNLKELGCALISGVPDDMDSLLKLPNVGPYAAGAYLSLHRGTRAIIPDANMARILGRVFGFEITPETRRKKSFIKLCEKITPTKKFREFNYAILDFGRTICKPQNPRTDICFLNDICFHAIKMRGNQ